MRIRNSRSKSQPTANDIRAERRREQTIISVIVANCLHDARVLDPVDGDQGLGPVTVDAFIDGDIPVRIEVSKQPAASAWVHWTAWPDEPGRRTWGTFAIHRLSTTKALLEAGSYDRCRLRSPRLAKIPLPDATWGLRSTDTERLGIETTY